MLLFLGGVLIEKLNVMAPFRVKEDWIPFGILIVFIKENLLSFLKTLQDCFLLDELGVEKDAEIINLIVSLWQVLDCVHILDVVLLIVWYGMIKFEGHYMCYT